MNWIAEPEEHTNISIKQPTKPGRNRGSMSLIDGLDKHTNISIKRPLESTKNGLFAWFVLIPFSLALFFAIDPGNQFFGKVGSIGRRVIGAVLTEATPDVQGAYDSMYNPPEQRRFEPGFSNYPNNPNNR